MGFKSFLLSKDLETVQALTGVLHDLDIAVEPCNQPFTAAKRLMEQPFDAIIIDCDDEQGAGWVLQSARMATTNKNSLTIAVVRGQPGARGPLKMGENFVIYKPIVVKQVENTLKAARSLMKGGAAHATPGIPTAVPAHSTASFSTTARGQSPGFNQPFAKPVRTFEEEVTPGGKASGTFDSSLSKVQEPKGFFDLNEIVESSPGDPFSATATETASRGTAASSPSLADLLGLDTLTEEPSNTPQPWPDLPPAVPHLQETPIELRAGLKPSRGGPQLDILTGHFDDRNSNRVNQTTVAQFRQATGAAPKRAKVVRSTTTMERMPSFEMAQESRPTITRILLIAASALLVVGVSYGLWHVRSNRAKVAAQHTLVVGSATSGQVLPQPVPEEPATSNTAAQNSVQAPVREAPSTTHAQKSPSPVPGPQKSKEKEEEPEPAPVPIVVASSHPTVTARATPEPETAEPPPSLETVVSSDQAGITPVIGSGPASLPSIAAPPTRVTVSQGVSQGMLLRQAKPAYPPLARERHLEGAVILKAVIGRDGVVRDLKGVSGPAVLVQSAISAVRQWRYRPYLLNGKPVEVQTMITVFFKL
jgi:protein TonB